MELQLKKRLIGAGAIFMLIVIFAPMVLDGGGEIVTQPIAKLVPIQTIDLTDNLTKHQQQVNGIIDAAANDQNNTIPLGEAALNTNNKNPQTLNTGGQPQTGVSQLRNEQVTEVTLMDEGGSEANTAAPNQAAPSSAFDIQAGWTLQVASFAERANAVVLIQKLNSDDIQSFLQPKRAAGRTLYIVYINPALQRDTVLAQAKLIEERHGLQGIIRKYTASPN